MYYDKRTVETTFDKHFDVSGHGETHSKLHLIQLRKPEDSAVYYCAAYYHSGSSSSVIKQKPSFNNSTKESRITQLHTTHICIMPSDV